MWQKTPLSRAEHRRCGRKKRVGLFERQQVPTRAVHITPFLYSDCDTDTDPDWDGLRGMHPSYRFISPQKVL